LERWSDVAAGMGFTEPGRQVLHCTFGTILMDPELGVSIRHLLEGNNDTYTEVLAEHFERDDPTGLLSSGEQAACSTCHSKAPTDHVFSRIRP